MNYRAREEEEEGGGGRMGGGERKAFRIGQQLHSNVRDARI